MRRAQPWLWLILLASVPLWLTDQYFLHVLITTGIFTIAAMSLNLLLGYTGQLSLGHVAFFGIGAYASALTSLGFDVSIFGFRIVHEPWPVIAGFAVGIFVAGLCGYAIGKLSFKVRGAYFVIVTISFAEVTRLIALNWVELTQGPLALNNIPPFALGFPGLGEATLWGKVPNYYVVLAVGAAAYVVIRRLVLSRIGRAMIALRENEPLATSLGIDVTRFLVLAAVVSAAIAGAAGGLYAHFVRIIDPDIFLFIYTVTMVIMVITGGKGTLAGPLVGGLIFGMLPVVLRAFASPVAQWIIYGSLMILIVFFLPRGIVPAVSEWWQERLPFGRPRLPLGSPRPDNKQRETKFPSVTSLPTDRVEPFDKLRKGSIETRTTTALAIEHVTVQFGGLTAVSDMSFTVAEGELVSLIGPNGAGKTTAFNVITGFLKPNHGKVSYRGVTLAGLKSHEVANLGLVRTFQKTSVFGNNTVFDNVLIGLHRHGKSSVWETLLALPRVRREEAGLREEAWAILDFVGLERRASELGAALPYGDQRLLEVAVALAARPSLILLDEPVSGMNASETASFIGLLGRIRERDVTVLLVEHDMHLVMDVSDRIVVLNYGKIIAEGPPAAIQQDPEVVRAYLGQGVRNHRA